QDTLLFPNYVSVSSVPSAGAVTANPDTVCSGSPSQLSVTGYDGHIQWQSSGDAISFADMVGDTSAVVNLVSPFERGYYRVTATGTCGMDSAAPVILVV